jgi:transcription initiation factor TFIIH subunit 2
MLRTVLLMDGSEAMNSSSDYLPSYLLAMRPPLLRFVEKYLDSTPLASLGIVVMRDGISHRLLSCTTSRNEIIDVLERDIFLHGGSGAMSLENGLRMAMSELVDMRKVSALAAAAAAAAGSTSATTESSATMVSSAKNVRATWKGSATQLSVLLVSASVTLIDPTDVFSVVNTLAALSVRINVVSLVGAVHVFDVCAVETGGLLHCPMNYDHLLHIMDDLATAHRAVAAARRKHREKRKRCSADAADTEKEACVDAPHLIPIGCPVYLQAPPPPTSASPSPQPQPQAKPSSSSSSSTATTTAHNEGSYYLACPQCHLIQLSVPTTCPMCRLLLCSAPMLYSTYVSHNSLVPAARRLRVVRSRSSTAAAEKRMSPSADVAPTAPAKANSEEVEIVEATDERPVRCALCMTRISMDASTSKSTITSEGARVWQCSSCASYRCDACHDFVVHTIGLCPHCLALR